MRGYFWGLYVVVGEIPQGLLDGCGHLFVWIIWRACWDRFCGRLRGIWGWLWFSCGVVHHERGLTAVFREFFVRAGKIFILVGGLRAGLSFYGV